MQNLNEFEVQLISGGDGYGTDGGHGYGGVGTTGGFGGGGIYGNGQGTLAVGGSGGGNGVAPGYQQSSKQTGAGYPASGMILNSPAKACDAVTIAGYVFAFAGLPAFGAPSVVTGGAAVGGLMGAMTATAMCSK